MQWPPSWGLAAKAAGAPRAHGRPTCVHIARSRVLALMGIEPAACRMHESSERDAGKQHTSSCGQGQHAGAA